MADTSQELANDTQSWFELGFSRGLTEPALIAGVPKAALVINGVAHKPDEFRLCPVGKGVTIELAPGAYTIEQK